MIVACAAVLAVLGTRPVGGARQRALIHPVFLALPLDDSPILTELTPGDPAEVLDLTVDGPVEHVPDRHPAAVPC